MTCPVTEAFVGGMDTDRPPQDFIKASSTQLGTIGEAIVAVELVLASSGRLAPFTPFADDDGIDLLLYDKATKRSLPIQVKSRARVDNARTRTVQFDVRTATFAEDGETHLIAVLLDGSDIGCAWLLPMADLKRHARQGRSKLIMVASAKETSRDKFSVYRHHRVDDLVRSIISIFSGQDRPS